MKLIHKSTGNAVLVGDEVELDGETLTVAYFEKPHKASASGRVTVQWEDGAEREYYVGVIGAEWVEREDRATPRPSIVRDVHLEYLDDLRETGTTNMFGAGPFLQRRFSNQGVSVADAREIIVYWMESFDERMEVES